VQAKILLGQEPIDSVTLLYYAAPFNLALFMMGSVLLEGSAPWTQFPQMTFSGQLWIGMAATCAAFYNVRENQAILAMDRNGRDVCGVLQCERGNVVQLFGY
jgi:hypothetical protein